MKKYTEISEGFVQTIQEKIINYKQDRQVNFYQKFIKEDSPLDILSSNRHSLAPDMMFGWKPKLPSCPCPLKFPNYTIDTLIPLIKKDDRYKIAFIGNRPLNSIQINQRYTYSWKYRQRYSLNIALVDDAYKKNTANQNIYQNQPQNQCEYEFDSSFQSGNLDLAVRIKPNQYDCYIRSDSNTKGHCNWFYFKISNKKRIGQVQVNICNIAKIKNLYNKGMKPFALEFDQNGIQQHNWSQDLCYDVSFVQRLSRFQNDKKSFQLQFKYNFKSENSEVLIAYGIPYTYSKLQSFIKQISSSHQEIVNIQKLCESLGGVTVPLIKITNRANETQKQFQPVKKAVIVTARIHPGQSHSSFLLQGFVKQLLQDKSNILRQMFTFYIIPMLNPDGVIVGNYRTSYSGKDLNRQFQNLEKFIFPEIFYLNELVMDIRKKHFKGVQFFFDFHGHSSKKNLFTYGPDYSPHNPYFLRSRIFAKLLQQITPVFSYKKSIFTISEGKNKTGRAHMIRKLKIPMVYTFQISNGMYETKNRQNILLNQAILTNCGNSILKGLFKYAKLQMKIPNHLIKPKVDTGNVKKRIIRSSKQIRTAIIKKRKPSKNLQNQKDIREGAKSAKVFSQEQVDSQLNKKQFNFLNLNEEQQRCQLFQNQQFQKIVQNLQIYDDCNQSQGGSDSQSQGEDLSKEQSDKLFIQIALKNQVITKQRQLKSKNVKITIKRPKMMTQNSKNILNQIKMQMKKNKNKKLLEILNERNKIKQVTQTNQTNKRLKIPQRAIFRQRSNFANFQTNKDICIQKVPIVQKNFNLEIDYQKA